MSRRLPLSWVPGTGQEHKRRKWQGQTICLGECICPEGCSAWAHELERDRVPKARAKECCQEREESLRPGAGYWDAWTVGQKSDFQGQPARPLCLGDMSQG